MNRPSIIAYTLFACTLAILSQISSENTPPLLYFFCVFINGLCIGSALNYTLAHLLHLTPPSTHFISTSLLTTFRGFAGSFGSGMRCPSLFKVSKDSPFLQFLLFRRLAKQSLILHSNRRWSLHPGPQIPPWSRLLVVFPLPIRLHLYRLQYRQSYRPRRPHPASPRLPRPSSNALRLGKRCRSKLLWERLESDFHIWGWACTGYGGNTGFYRMGGWGEEKRGRERSGGESESDWVGWGWWGGGWVGGGARAGRLIGSDFYLKMELLE